MLSQAIHSMAELVGLLASIAGVAIAGNQTSTLLYSTVRKLRGVREEIAHVAREVTTLSTAFSEICNAIQADSEEGLAVFSAAILTIANLVQNSQDVYRKIHQAVSHQSGIAIVSVFCCAIWHQQC